MLDVIWTYPDEFKCDLCREGKAEHALDDAFICEGCYDALTERLKQETYEMLEEVAKEFALKVSDVWECFVMEIDSLTELEKEREKTMDSQNKKVKYHLEHYGEITPIEAFSHYGIMRLAARIADLRASGLDIETDYAKTKNGARYAVYRLAK